jgi:hypothetical protein
LIGRAAHIITSGLREYTVRVVYKGTAVDAVALKWEVIVAWIHLDRSILPEYC